MSKLTEYTAATRFDSGDILIKDGTNGTKKITAANAAVEFAGLVSAAQHRLTYRGASLGSSVTSDQQAAISDGTFDDLYIGDYWTINSVNWRIWDMDYWYNIGDTAFTKHHLVIVPDSSLGSCQMNTSATTTGGYVGSAFYTDSLPTIIETVESAFGDLLLTHREYLCNAVTDGYPSGGAWFDSSVELMNENMLYGCHVMTPASDGSSVYDNRTSSKQQLAGPMLYPRIFNNRVGTWLRDVVSATTFAFASNLGYAYCYSASYSYTVRPAFPIGVA